MAKAVNELAWNCPIRLVEQSNHTVKVRGWEGVASHVVDDGGDVEGTLIWLPSTRISDLK